MTFISVICPTSTDRGKKTTRATVFQFLFYLFKFTLVATPFAFQCASKVFNLRTDGRTAYDLWKGCFVVLVGGKIFCVECRRVVQNLFERLILCEEHGLKWIPRSV